MRITDGDRGGSFPAAVGLQQRQKKLSILNPTFKYSIKVNLNIHCSKEKFLSYQNKFTYLSCKQFRRKHFQLWTSSYVSAREVVFLFLMFSNSKSL